MAVARQKLISQKETGTNEKGGVFLYRFFSTLLYSP